MLYPSLLPVGLFSREEVTREYQKPNIDFYGVAGSISMIRGSCDRDYHSFNASVLIRFAYEEAVSYVKKKV